MTETLLETTSLVLLESVEGRPYRYRGVFTVFDIENDNKRVYPAAIFVPEIERVQDKVKRDMLCGELDHPKDYNEVRYQNVSHKIVSLEVVGDKVIGELEILDTPSGRIMRVLADAGVPVMVSSRGLGDTKPLGGGKNEVTRYRLITYDIVSTPSYGDNVILKDTAQYQQVRNEITSIRESLKPEEEIEFKPLFESLIERLTPPKNGEVISQEEKPLLEEEKIEQKESDKKMNESFGIENHKKFINLTQENEALQKELLVMCESGPAHVQDTLNSLRGENKILNEELKSYRNLVKQLQEDVQKAELAQSGDIQFYQKRLKALSEDVCQYQIQLQQMGEKLAENHSPVLGVGAYQDQIQKITEELAQSNLEKEQLTESLKTAHEISAQVGGGNDTQASLIEVYQENEGKLREVLQETANEARVAISKSNKLEEEVKMLKESFEVQKTTLLQEAGERLLEADRINESNALGYELRLFCESKGLPQNYFEKYNFKTLKEFKDYSESNKVGNANSIDHQVNAFLNEDKNLDNLVESMEGNVGKFKSTMKRMIGRV